MNQIHTEADADAHLINENQLEDSSSSGGRRRPRRVVKPAPVEEPVLVSAPVPVIPKPSLKAQISDRQAFLAKLLK